MDRRAVTVTHLAAPDRDTHDRIARVFARAFFTDPAFTYIFPDPQQRNRQLTWLWQRINQLTARHGHTYVTEHACATETARVVLQPSAAVLCRPPHAPASSSLWRKLRIGLLKMPFALGRRSLGRLSTVSSDVGRHYRSFPAPFWLINAIAVEPDRQGQGLGSALLAPVLARADAQGLPCGLVTHNPANLVFYRRHGFAVVAERPIAPDGPPGWALLRQVCAASPAG